jgi:hypothetical protein
LTVTGRDLVVLGYAGEPYLRVGPAGAFTNRRSSATFLNRDRFPTSQLPTQVNPKAAPVWQRISRDPTVAWHDHRAHWMGSSDPPAVQAAPWQLQVINPQWRVELRDGRRPIIVTGDLRWVPTPHSSPVRGRLDGPGWSAPLPACSALSPPSGADTDGER